MRPAMNVSRETLERLEIYASLLEKWNPKINLVSKASLEHLWERHIRDSIQVAQAIHHPVKHWVDLGSGGGFPGLVVALMASDIGVDQVTLIESDQRKCAFLRTVLRETSVSGEVIQERIEIAPPQSANVLSARALTDLSGLLGFAMRHLAEGGICLFPKGVNWEKEVEAAREEWQFSVEAVPSQIEAGAAILRIGEISRV
ncbi:16S rRNA (guanine(527)-N(7))-methyltransferase RsmG [Litorivita pollutaquae]|uniref:Ribosomal RNA small subunit methyltransferase G n=2 Tax=Litorivita pollutaquae TaxID=2200892 RepID=A0A2V4N0Z2_9RHOB|nr:16S rRNA (guanine(527)-N(7))-methyltransferase RsmG [Litorivita pollutaquae]